MGFSECHGSGFESIFRLTPILPVVGCKLYILGCNLIPSPHSLPPWLDTSPDPPRSAKSSLTFVSRLKVSSSLTVNLRNNPSTMVNLSQQKRLAASVTGVGQRKSKSNIPGLAAAGGGEARSHRRQYRVGNVENVG